MFASIIRTSFVT